MIIAILKKSQNGKKMIFILALSASLSLHANLNTYNQEAYNYLNPIALASGADKSSNHHNYTEVYSQYFDPIKDLPFKFLEIGIFRGNSVKLWEDYFPNAELHFIDISYDPVQYFSKRSHYHLVDQQNRTALEKFVQETGGAFDIILDDGGHMMQQQIVSFLTLFPHVKKGGMYIIEDLHTSYWSSYGGGNHTATTISFLKKLIDDVNYVGATTGRASHENLDSTFVNELKMFQKDIFSIHFYDSIAIIKKR